jgi:HEAT repeat protein
MKDPNPEFIKQLLVELRDVRKDKRRTAVMKLGMTGGDQAVRALMNTVENQYEDLIVRGRAALMLGKLGDSRAVDALIRALDAPGFQTPLYAAEALGKLGDSRAIEPLMMIAANGRDKVRETALEALRRLGYDPDATEPETFEPEAELE